MENHPPTRQSLLRYLLHEIDEDEREHVDTLLITDEEYHAAFQEVEYDLLDALDAGELTPEEAARARRALRPSDRWTTRQAAPNADSGPRLALVPPSVKRATAVTRRPSSWPVWIVAAALVLVTLALGIWAIRNHRADSLTQARIAAPNPLQVPRSPVGPEPSLTIVEPPPPPRTAPLAVLLLPRASRSPHTLHLPIPHDASVVRIDWPSAGANANIYQLQVLTDTGKVACTTRGLALRGVDPPIVRFLCPARDVPSGMDFMRVTALPADPDVPSLIEVTVSVERTPASAG